MSAKADVTQIDTFGEVAAEDDAVLDYFVSTGVYKQISAADRILVLGRKGAGKTALVRYFTERAEPHVASKALRFSSYPWSVHAARADYGAAGVEAYTASWTFLIAVELASLALKLSPDPDVEPLRKIRKFLIRNYGQPDTELKDILAPDALRLEGSFEPTILGSKLFKVDLKRGRDDLSLGRELSALSEALLDAVQNVANSQLDGQVVLLHFDELDQGLTVLDEERANILTGLVLAARAVRKRFAGLKLPICPVVYLRTDIWEKLAFSDKNKISETSTLVINWGHAELKSLIEARASSKIGSPVKFEDLEDGQLTRGSQPKWSHIIARTYLRPRDVIKFSNVGLQRVRLRMPDPPVQFTNKDIAEARPEYSDYLKRELDDEIKAHWPQWGDALAALTALQTITFTSEAFAKAYESQRSDAASPDAKQALASLFDYSVIGYNTRSGYGGSAWIYRYESPNMRWDPGVNLYKVHYGLKEYCRLKEERA
jgi:hypothetical protein